MNIKVLVPIAQGVEDIETSTIIDVLRRAEAAVHVAGIDDAPVCVAARGLKLVPDTTLTACLAASWQMIVLPGGLTGAEQFAACPPLLERLVQQRDAGGWFAAICATPALALAPAGLLAGYRATCYPAMRESLGAAWVDAPVVRDRNCITSQGPGTAIAFALELVEVLFDRETRTRIGRQMLVPGE